MRLVSNRTKVAVILAAIGLFALVTIVPLGVRNLQATGLMFNLSPGDTVTISCPTRLISSLTDGGGTLVCEREAYPPPGSYPPPELPTAPPELPTAPPDPYPAPEQPTAAPDPYPAPEQPTAPPEQPTVTPDPYPGPEQPTAPPEQPTAPPDPYPAP